MAGSDGKSFEELAVPHLDMVFRIALRWTNDQHEAEDLVQEAYLRGHKSFNRFEMREYGIRPWLLRIMRNAFLNRAARQARAPKAADQQVLDQMHGEAATVEEAMAPPTLDYDRLDAEVKTAMQNLAPEFREALTLWATMELSYQEIADILEVPIGTVMSRLHRARQRMVRDLDDYARENRLHIGREL